MEERMEERGYVGEVLDISDQIRSAEDKAAIPDPSAICLLRRIYLRHADANRADLKGITVFKILE
jgi:hypothetical protein